MAERIETDGPRGRALATFRLLTDPLTYYRGLLERYGDPVRVPALNGDLLLTADPDGAREILSAPPEIFDPFATEALAGLVGRYSLLTLAGAEHRRQRKLVMPSFHGNRMRAYAQTIADITDRRFLELPIGSELVALKTIAPLALEVIVQAIFGITEPAKVAEVSDAVEDVIAKLRPMFMFAPSLQVAPFGLGPWATFQKAAERCDALLYEQIEAARGREPGDDILSMLLQARDEDGNPMSDAELRDELVTLVVAGHETSSVAISWALYHLHRNPVTLAALREELDQHRDDDIGTIPRLAYLHATVTETLRLFPIVPDFVRMLNSDFEVLGHRVPAGSGVAVATTVMHHDADLYPEPMRFDPSRWLEHRPPKWAYFPFGGGHRRCVGAAFAEFEIAIVVARVVSNYELELREPEELYPKRRNVTMAPPTGVRFVITGRRQAG